MDFNTRIWAIRWRFADAVLASAKWVEYRIRWSRKTRNQSAAWARGENI